ncbi:hypothetical protein CI1B_09870 [Bradyrhizobium ivorense]|uniref:Uncharacterized protein n=1 Tax=Bradyrhizobium ivorense TaxID=2511166 RepID=A0A508STJ5_9BRAD|nr:hypothetical protein [Bradyrhizobium ivorense]VIO65879.1 hypothetical protein CI1B_09870 [Bradyrhizobium ivorense]
MADPRVDVIRIHKIPRTAQNYAAEFLQMADRDTLRRHTILGR